MYHRYDKIEENNNIVVQNQFHPQNYIMCFDTSNNENFIISDVFDLKF